MRDKDSQLIFEAYLLTEGEKYDKVKKWVSDNWDKIVYMSFTASLAAFIGAMGYAKGKSGGGQMGYNQATEEWEPLFRDAINQVKIARDQTIAAQDQAKIAQDQTIAAQDQAMAAQDETRGYIKARNEAFRLKAYGLDVLWNLGQSGKAVNEYLPRDRHVTDILRALRDANPDLSLFPQATDEVEKFLIEFVHDHGERELVRTAGRFITTFPKDFNILTQLSSENRDRTSRLGELVKVMRIKKSAGQDITIEEEEFAEIRKEVTLRRDTFNHVSDISTWLQQLIQTNLDEYKRKLEIKKFGI
jgi:hypothetical protein